jgi:hypothetical protein
MTRDQWKDVIEGMGVLSIVASLIFVAFEIRQNTDAVRSSAIQDISRLSYDATVLSIEKDEIREARLAVCRGDLDESQRFLLQLFYAALMRIQMNRFYQLQLGILDEQMILSLGGKGGAYRNPYFAEIWPVLKVDFTEDFQAYIERDVLPLAQDSC